MRRWYGAMPLVVVVMFGLVFAPGCAMTKTMLNKASFGLVGGPSSTAARDSTRQEERAVKVQQKADKKAREQAWKQHKQAEREAQRTLDAGRKRSWLNKASFGLLGKQEDDATALLKAQERQAQEQREAAARARKEADQQQRKAARQAMKAERPPGKRSLANKLTFGLVGREEAAPAAAAKTAQVERISPREQRKAAKRQAREAEPSQTQQADRTFLSKVSFGLVGGKEGPSVDEEAASKQARKEAKRAEKEARRNEKQQRKETKRTEEAEPGPARSLMSKISFGLFGDEETPKPPAPTEPQLSPDAPPAEAQQKETEGNLMSKLTFGLVGRKQEEQQAPSAKEAAPSDTPSAAAQQKQPERRLMSKLTLGLVGRKEQEPAPVEAEPTETTAAPEGEELKPERRLASKLTFGLIGGDEEPLAGEALAEAQAKARRKQHLAALSGMERKLGELPFTTGVRQEPRPSGRRVVVADRVSYSRYGYGICDIGHVRIAVKGMTFEGTWRTYRVVVDSSEREVLQGTAGKGNRRFEYEYNNGVTQCRFGSVEFTIAGGVLSIGSIQAPVGDGHTLIVVTPDGEVLGSYDI